MREQLSTHSEEGMLAKTKPLDVHCVTGADTSLPTGAALSTREPRDATSSVHRRLPSLKLIQYLLSAKCDKCRAFS